MKKVETDFSRLPSVEQILQTPSGIEMLAEFGRGLVVRSIRLVMDEARNKARADGQIPSMGEILANVRVRIENDLRATLLPVINASGVILHTNLGRAPISNAARNAIGAVSSSYNTLEFEIATGKRGARINHIEKLITLVTGAEAALVVCNNAAAVLLALAALARRKPVAISRTQMVEIGDGFRIPEVLTQSGARLVEIGTTNRVHVNDYKTAIEDGARAVLRVHHSNFKLTGFTCEPSLQEMVAVTHQHGSLLIDNLGSGALLDTAKFGLAHEPMVQESIQEGADLVCFSGDKLVGGPQAGIIAGRKDLVNRIRRHPLARAVRADKMSLAGLAETFRHYAREEAECEIPIWKMISMDLTRIRERAAGWAAELGFGEVISGKSTIGGGSLPEETLPTWLLSLKIEHPDRFLKRLRMGSTPIIARIEDDRVLFDPRTVFPEEESAFMGGLKNANPLKRE